MKNKYLFALAIVLQIAAASHYGIYTDEKKIYICLPVESRVKIIQKNNLSKAYLDNSTGYQLSAPTAICVVNEKIYLLDSANGELVSFTEINGQYRYEKTLSKDLFRARDIACWQNKIYILDSQRSRIIIYDIEQKKAVQIVAADQNIQGAYGLDVSAYGEIFVADTFRHRILRFDQKGNLQRAYGLMGEGTGRIKYPRDVSAGYGNYFYIADSGIVAQSKDGNSFKDLHINDSSTIIRNIHLEKDSAALYVATATQYYVQDMGFNVSNIALKSSYFSGTDRGPVVQLKADEELKVKYELVCEQEVLFSQKYLLDQGFHILGIDNLKLKEGPYQLRLIIESENALEPAIYKKDVVADNTGPSAIKYRITPDLQLKPEKRVVPEYFLEVEADEPCYLKIQLLDKDGSIIDQFNSITATRRIAANWQITAEIWHKLEGEYLIVFQIVDRAGNQKMLDAKEFKIKKDHPLIKQFSINKPVINSGQEIIMSAELKHPARAQVKLYPYHSEENKIMIADYILAAGMNNITAKIPDDVSQGSHFLSLLVITDDGLTDEYLQLIKLDNSSPDGVMIKAISDTVYYGEEQSVVFEMSYPEDVWLDVYCQGEIVGSKQLKRSKPETFSWDTSIGSSLLKPGQHNLIFAAKDPAGNFAYRSVTINVIAYAPIIEKLKQDRKVLVDSGYPGYGTLDLEYFIAGGSGEVLVDLQIVKNGQLVAVPLSKYRQFPGRGKAAFSISGRQLDSGIYNYVLKVTNERGVTALKTGEFYCINEKPFFQQFDFDQSAISPADNDGNKDQVKFLIKPYQSVLYSFGNNEQLKPLFLKVDISGDGFEQQKYVEIDPGLAFYIWSGLDKEQKPLKDGSYQLSFELIDSGGLISDKQQVEIIVANSQGRILDIASNIEADSFIYNPLETTSNLLVDIELKYLDLWQTVSAILRDSRGELIKSWPEYEFKGSANYQISWDGKDDHNDYVNDGQYFIEIRIVDEAGNDHTYGYEQIPRLAITYLDQQIIRQADGTQICSPSVIINTAGELEYNYCKDFVAQTISDRSSASNPGGDRKYFVIDHYQQLNGSRLHRSNDDLIVRIVPMFSGQSTYVLPDDGPLSYPGTMSYLPGRYYLQLDNVNNWGSGYLDFVGLDVWYKRAGTDSEFQVDNPSLELDGSVALERKARLDCVRVTVDSISYSHKVDCINDQIYYKRSSAAGSQTGTDWIKISQEGMHCSEPSITVLPGTDTLEICWIQRDQIDSDPYLVSQVMPDNFRNVRQDQQISTFDNGLTAALHGTAIEGYLEGYEQLNIDYHISYPNPFYDDVTIRYKLSTDADVKITIVDLSGQPVRTLEFDSRTEGGKKSTIADKYNDIVWDGRDHRNRDLSAGPYMYIIEAKSSNGQKIVKKGKMVKWRK